MTGPDRERLIEATEDVLLDAYGNRSAGVAAEIVDAILAALPAEPEQERLTEGEWWERLGEDVGRQIQEKEERQAALPAEPEQADREMAEAGWESFWRRRYRADRAPEPVRATDPVRAADDLLRRLGEWDMLYVSPEGKPVTADGPYWQGEIARVRAALAADREPPPEGEKP